MEEVQMVYTINYFRPDEQLLYLRKSRQDDPNETVEEVLAKHEIQLQEYAEREFGGRIPEENIYREIASGESIATREEIKKVLARIEDPTIKSVIVIEPARLSRGDLGDCDKIIKSFQLSPFCESKLQSRQGVSPLIKVSYSFAANGLASFHAW